MERSRHLLRIIEQQSHLLTLVWGGGAVGSLVFWDPGLGLRTIKRGRRHHARGNPGGSFPIRKCHYWIDTDIYTYTRGHPCTNIHTYAHELTPMELTDAHAHPIPAQI